MVKQAGTTSSSRFTHKKRKVAGQPESVRQLVQLFESLFHLGTATSPNGGSSMSTTELVFDLTNVAEKQRLVQTLWSPNLPLLLHNSLTRANPELCEWLNSQAVDSLDRRHRALRNEETWGRWEGVLSVLVRAHNLRSVPLVTAVISIAFWHHQSPNGIWQPMSTLFRVVLSKSWVKGVLPLARELDPGPAYTVAAGFSIACFDNFTIRAAGGLMTDETVGERLDMTNWASLAVPAAAVRPSLVLNIDQLIRAGGLFKQDLDREGLIDLFSPAHPELQAFRRSRFILYLEAAERKKLDDTPKPAIDLPPMHMVLHMPIWDRLQSSYDDVNAELQTIRSNPMHRSSSVILVGCDGAGYMRVIHRLAQDPDLYFNTPPAVIPQLGEHPHGTFHILHCGWRQWWPLIERFVHVVQNMQVRAEPIVSLFNQHEHFLRILTQAISEWFVEMCASASGIDFRAFRQFERAVQDNTTTCMLFHFLFDYAFLFKAARDAVRANNSKDMDLVWRDFLHPARSADGNKTQYAQMCVSRIYFGLALSEPLQHVYHNLRSLKLLRTHVGYDMFIERVNLLIRQKCTTHISRSSIAEFLRNYCFTDRVDGALEELVSDAEAGQPSLKDAGPTVQAIKDFLKDKVGDNFADAIEPSDDNLLNLNLSRWGGGPDLKRDHMPWEKKLQGPGYREYVSDHLQRLCTWQTWA